MSMATPYSMRRARGFTLFELIIVVCLVAVFAGVLLDRFSRYQELAERAAMERTVANIRTALNLQFAGLIVKGRQQEIPRLEEINPFNLLGEGQGNYLGEHETLPADAEPGSWYYDPKRREAVYVVRQARHFHNDDGAENRIRFRTLLLRGDPLRPGERNGEFTGVSFAARSPYRWEVR